MSTDAWIEEHWIGEAVLPRPRRAPKLPALPPPHAPTCSRGNAALAAHAQSRDSARHPGDGLSARQDGRNVVDQQARKLTQPIDGADPSAAAKPDARLIRLLIRARRFNAALIGSDGVPFAALARREGVSPSYFTRLVPLSYLAPELTPN